jgi:hypothetical protein
LRPDPWLPTVACMKPRTRRALWILFGILLVASLFLAGPAHNVLHHGAEDLGGCDVCHAASLELPRFEPLLFWLAAQPIELAHAFEQVTNRLLAEQGHARAPPTAG